MIKIKHLDKYNKNKLENYNGDEIGLIYNHNNNNESYENNIYSYDHADIYNTIIENNKFVDENFKLELLGGAPKKNSNKKEKEKEYNMGNTNKLIHIKDIQKDLLNDIINNFEYIFKNNNIDDNKLLEIVHRLIKNKNYDLSNIDLEMILRYLRENLLTSIKNKIIFKHPLFETIKNDNYINSIKSLVEEDNILNFKNKVIISKAISFEWEDLTSLYNFNNRFSFKENIIHPLFFMIYALKFPGIEDLTIIQDYSTMINELKNDDFDGSNLILLILRISDPNYIYSNNKKNMSAIGNENLRINISILLKEIAFSIRSGVLENKLSDILLASLLDINNNNAKFEEEKLIQNLLSIFSFKPTLISKGTNNIFLSQFNQNNYTIPEAVYNIEYPINDFQFLNNSSTPIFSNVNLKNIVYDPITKKVIFTYNNNEIPSSECVQEELLKKIYNCIEPIQQKVDLNEIGSTILSRNLNINEDIKLSNPVNVLLTNGIFIMSIPRETIRYSTNPSNNLFYTNRRKKSINISPVLLEKTLTINRVNYELSGGLCYDILDNNSCLNYNINYVNSENNLGIYAIIKLSNNKWIEYNPNIFLTNSRILKFIEKALNNNYKKDDPVDKDKKKIEYNDWLIDNENEILKHIINHQVSFVDMYIEEEEAIEKLSTYGNLIFYKEPYDYYKTRCEEKYVF